MGRRGRAIGLGLTWCLAFLLMVLTGCGGGDTAASTTTSLLAVPLANDACLSCHADFEQVTAKEDQKEFSHDLHLQQRLDCVTCHKSVGHDGTTKPEQSTCDECHGLPMPHAADYETSHGNDVSEGGTDTCDNCHNIYLHCQECHGLQMPHPAEWTSKHGDIATPEMETCQRCHEKDFCLSCHPVEMPHPKTWTATHGRAVAEKGSPTCTTCHQANDCTACHGLPMPHPDDWGAAHLEAAERDRENCLLCHQQKDCEDCHAIHQTHGKGGGA